jgi:Flp pilus assembly protein TadG
MIDKHLQPAHTKAATHSAARQRGQATVEFAVLALVLVPLLIGAVLVGKYLDLMNTTEAASRYVAFEGMARNSSSTWKTDAELAAEVRRRFFSNADAPVKTNDTAGDFAAHRNPLWTDHAGRAFISDFAQEVSVQTRIDGRNTIAAARPYANSFDLPDQNWYTAAVTVRPGNVPAFPPFDALNLNITRRTVLLTDPWTARNTTDTRGRIEGSLLAYPIGRIEPLVNLIGQIPPLILDPALRLSAFDWDAVPCDRLVGGCP